MSKTRATQIASEIAGGRREALLVLHARGGMKWWRLREAVEDRLSGKPHENVDLSNDPLFEFHYIGGPIDEDIAGLTPLGKAVAARITLPSNVRSEEGK